MIVSFKGASAQEHPGTGVLLVPGLNDLPDAAAHALLHLGLVVQVAVADPPSAESQEPPMAPTVAPGGKKGKGAQKDVDTSGESRG